MAKQTLNIDDFSGGINTSKNPRDLDVNESPEIDGLMSYQSGILDLKGGFVRPVGFADSSGGFKEEYVNLGINNLYGVQPEYSFRTVNIATVTVSSDTATFATTGEHGLSTGTSITVYNQSAGSDWRGKILLSITSTGYSTFTSTGATGLTSAIDVAYAVGVSYDDTPNIGIMNTIPHKQIVQYNMFLLKAAHMGKFGFYRVGNDKGWTGSTGATTNAFGGNPWLFDTRYLWDWDQREEVWTPATANSSNGVEIEELKVHDAFYESGVVRVLTEPSGKWNGNTCRRPVNYTFIPDRTHFYNDTSFKYSIRQGWYPLRSHILCQQEYTDSLYNHHENGGGLSLAFTASNLEAFCAGTAVTYSSKPYRIEIGIGTGNNAKEGDWQFATGDQRKIGLGISLIYDSMDRLRQVESPVCKLDSVINISGEGSVSDDQALYLYAKFTRGLTAGNGVNTGLGWGLNDATTQTGFAISELRGSGVDSSTGYSNHGAWNPRIVGINIWLTEDYNGEFSSPLWLAEIPFKSGEFGRACDGLKSSSYLYKTGDSDGLFANGTMFSSHMIFKGIKTIPTLSYLFKNSYKHDENISAWYTTSAIINRRLYAGNVSYFDHRPQDAATVSNSEKMVSFPDRILVSPPEKFDVLPSSNWIDVMPQDGQSITKLVGFNKNLLVFKNNDMFVIDCSTSPPALVKTIKGKGTNFPTMVTQTPEHVFWCNSDGVYGLTGENEIIDLLTNIDIKKWQDVFNTYTHLLYDPQGNLLIVMGKKEGESLHDKRALIIDLKTGGLFFKTSPAEYSFQNYSGGVIMDNNLYVTGFIPGNDQDGEADAGEEFFGHVGDEHDAGEHSQGMISFQFTDEDSSAGENIPSANARHILVRRGSTWGALNTVAFDITSAANNTRAAERFIKDANRKSLDNDYYKASFDYNEDTGYFSCVVTAREKGSAYNTSAASLGGKYGTTGIAFASGTAEANINEANIDNFKMIGLLNGSNYTAGTVRISLDRGGQTKAGVSYFLSINRSSTSTEKGKSSDTNYQWLYVTGNSSKYKSADSSNYADETDASVTDAVRNDRLILNIHEFLQENDATSPFSHMKDADKFKIGEAYTVGDVTGDSGDKYFDLTARPDPDSENNEWELLTETYSGTGGDLLKWDNLTTKVYNSSTTYITPDFDFGQPNVRKKVYKAYITYKSGIVLGNGKMAVYFKVNQAGSWTAATTEGTDDSGVLDSTLTFTRQAITFGSATSGIYSFALKFQASTPLKGFVINDITIVYRVKSVR